MFVVGVGTQDSLALAEAFIESTGIRSFPMLWDPTFASWEALGVYGQPAGMLLSSTGVGRAQWSGPIPEDQVLEEAAALG